MRAAALSASVLGVAREAPIREEHRSAVEDRGAHAPDVWSRERFAGEQIRGLVRQVFDADATPSVRQVVVIPIDVSVRIGGICLRVGECLAAERMASVAIVERRIGGSSRTRKFGPESTVDAERYRGRSLREFAQRLRSNVWVLGNASASADATPLQAYMAEVRKEFDYSIIEGPPGGESEDAIAAAQCGDGMILAVSAQSTRRVLARKVKDKLQASQVRLLGVVLTEREFPIPEGIYRRL